MSAPPPAYPQQQQPQQPPVGQRLFSYLDGKGSIQDGTLSYQEFQPLCKQIGWADETVLMLWNQTDVDKSGTLTFNEFIQFANRPDVLPYLGPMENKLCGAYQAPQATVPQASVPAPIPQPTPQLAVQPGQQLFGLLQQQGKIRNGVLAWADFLPLCSQIGWQQNIAQTLWQQTDTDRSGTLSYQEFLTFAARPDVKPYLVPLEQKMCAGVSSSSVPSATQPQYRPQPQAISTTNITYNTYQQPQQPQPVYHPTPVQQQPATAIPVGQVSRVGQAIPMAQPVVHHQPQVVVASAQPATTVIYQQSNRCPKCNGTGWNSYKHKPCSCRGGGYNSSHVGAAAVGGAVMGGIAMGMMMKGPKYHHHHHGPPMHHFHHHHHHHHHHMHMGFHHGPHFGKFKHKFGPKFGFKHKGFFK